MWKITQDKKNQFRAALYARNGNEIAHTSKGYDSLDDIYQLIDKIRAGNFVSEYETANVKVNGHAYFFSVFCSETGKTLFVSTVYRSEGHRNTRNQARISVEKGMNSIDRYKLGKIAIDI